MDSKEIRLRIVEGLLPGLTRLGVNNPDNICKVANALESYVNTGYKIETVKDSKVAPVKRRSRPKKPTIGDNPVSGPSTNH